MSKKENGSLVGIFPSIPKQDRAYQKKGSLLESGRELFIKNGYKETTTKDIASHAGMAIGTFYRYFSDKRQLLMSLLEDNWDSMSTPSLIFIDKDPENTIADRLTEDHKRLNKIGLHRVLSELLPYDDEMADLLAAIRRIIHDRILQGLDQAKEKALTWDDLDLNTLAGVITVMLEGVSQEEEKNGANMNFHKLSKVICRMVYPPEIIQKLKNREITFSNNLFFP